MKTGVQKDRKTGRQEDRRTELKKYRRTGGQENGRTGGQGRLENSLSDYLCTRATPYTNIQCCKKKKIYNFG